MTIKATIEYTDLAQHQHDPNKVEIAGGQIRHKSQVKNSELLFFNFDTDETAKRGAYALSLPDFNLANPNTYAVNNGWLELKNDDYSFGYINNISEIVSDLSFSTKVKVNFLNVSTPVEILRLVSNIDDSMIRFYFSNQGGGATRVYRQVVNSVAAIVSTSIIKTYTFAVDDIIEIGVSVDSVVSELKTYIDGVVFSTIAVPSFDFSDCNLQLGGPYTSKTRQSYTDLILWNTAEDLSYDGVRPEWFSYDIGENIIATTMPLLMDTIKDFTVLEDNNDDNTISRYGVMKNLVLYWYNTVSLDWELSNYSQAQMNTPAEIKANADTFPLVQGVGAYIQILKNIKSLTGYHSITLENFYIEYSFNWESSAVITCIVYSEVLDNGGLPVEGAIVSFDSKDKLYNNSMILKEVFVVTGADGKWSLPCIETETQNSSGTFTVTYPDQLKPKTYKRKIIPNFPTKKFEDLLEEV